MVNVTNKKDILNFCQVSVNGGAKLSHLAGGFKLYHCGVVEWRNVAVSTKGSMSTKGSRSLFRGFR